MSILDVDSIDVGYGETQVINDLSLDCSDDEVVTVLGRNGMGKTTLLKCIMGVLPATAGSIEFLDEEVTDFPPYRRARQGMTLVPQDRGLFPKLTVRENLQMGLYAAPEREGIELEDVFEYFPVLEDRLTQKAGTLSGGEQQMLATARSLVTNPKLMLLDEPSEGVQPSIVERMSDIYRNIHEQHGISMIIVEQNISLALSIADRGYIIEGGEITVEGSIDELSDDELLRKKIGV